MNRKTSAGLHQITYDATEFAFELFYSKRKTLVIRIHPDRMVTVDAPTGTSLERVREFVQRKSAWITRKLREFEAYAQPVMQPRQYVSGEVYRYLGRQVRLKVETGTPSRVILSDEHLVVTAPTAGHVATLVQGWFRRQAERVFTERMAVCLPLAQAIGIPSPEKLTVREMKSRWGSCSGRGRITLNLRLVQVEIDLIDYVILHELCHLKELNHSKRFYALMTRILPDWKEKRQRLNRSPVIL